MGTEKAKADPRDMALNGIEIRERKKKKKMEMLKGKRRRRSSYRGREREANGSSPDLADASF